MLQRGPLSVSGLITASIFSRFPDKIRRFEIDHEVDIVRFPDKAPRFSIDHDVHVSPGVLYPYTLK